MINKPGTCQWFALCDHEAVGVVRHPILGDVPTCNRCATNLGLEIEPPEQMGLQEDVMLLLGSTDDIDTFTERSEALSRVVNAVCHDANAPATATPLQRKFLKGVAYEEGCRAKEQIAQYAGWTQS